jgi:protein-tyrosine-phosphatase
VATILVVCTGNICRSPMAEGLLRQRLFERGILDVDVESAGVAGWEDSPATSEAVKAVAEYGVDISEHLARRLSGSMADRADLIIAMCEEHADAVARLLPEAAPRTFTLKELVNLLDDVSLPPIDPTEPEHVRDRLDQVVSGADALRFAGARHLPDPDIADPLGLGLEAYRATAWELGELVDRLMAAVFPDEQAPPADAIPAAGADHTTGDRG